MNTVVRAKESAKYEDLYDLPPMVKGEILDGVLYTSPWPCAWRNRIKGEIMARLFGHRRTDPDGWWILFEPGVHLTRAAELVPDVAGWRRSAVPEFPSDWFTSAPDWACEVLTSVNRDHVMQVKRRFYAEIGVAFLWSVDFEANTLEVSRLHEGRWVEVGIYSGSEGVRAAPFEDVEFDLSEWWE